MNVAEFVRSLARRPYSLALIAILAAIAGYLGYSSTTPLYQSTAVAVVIPPGSGSPDAMLNPLVNLNNNMGQLAAVLATSLQSDEGHRAAVDAGGTGNFTVNTIVGDASMYAQLSPQLVIVAEADEPDAARGAAAALVDHARDSLNRIQLDSAVPVVNNALLIPSVEPTTAEAIPTSALRSAGTYALAAVLAGLMVLLIIDAAVQVFRKARHRRADAAAPSEPDTGATTDTDTEATADVDARS